MRDPVEALGLNRLSSGRGAYPDSWVGAAGGRAMVTGKPRSLRAEPFAKVGVSRAVESRRSPSHVGQ